ncbi:MAG: azurin [Cytophagaceae bacterium]|nr:azurin [Cytophagaceae bacterium]
MRILKTIALSALTVLFINCGGGDKKEDKKEEVKLKTNTSTSTKKEDPNVTEIVLLANDQMQFNMKEIKVPAGKKVKLVLRHTGKQPVEVMGHNFVLLTQGTQMSEFAAKASTARDNDYIPEGTDQVIAHTKMIGGGQETSITFDAPEKGEYTFICSFPGHYSMMNGKFIVE